MRLFCDVSTTEYQAAKETIHVKVWRMLKHCVIEGDLPACRRILIPGFEPNKKSLFVVFP